MMYLLSLGIYDDDDVEPTFVFAEIEGDITLAQVEELRKVGSELYGTDPPPHAQFWDCHPDNGGYL